MLAILLSQSYGCTTRPHLQPSEKHFRLAYRVADVFPTLWSAYDGAPQPNELDRVTYAVDQVVRAFPQLFQANVIGIGRRTPKERTLNDRLSFYLPILVRNREEVRRFSDKSRSALSRYAASFRQHFPDFSWRGTVYMTLSLGAFDGGLRRVAAKLELLFGIDRIVELHGSDADLGPLFHHELFHLYHGQFDSNQDRSDDRTVGDSLWSEGLAVYVSKRLNPKSSHRALLIPDDLLQRGQAQIRSLATELRSKLSSKSPQDYRDFFLVASTRKDIPPRAGYFVGLRVAETVAQKVSLSEMVRLRGKKLSIVIDKALRALEDN